MSPVTFSERVLCRYSPSATALTTWLQWMDEGLPQAQLITMIKEGLIDVAADKEGYSGFTRLAWLLRSAGIGFGRQRSDKLLCGFWPVSRFVCVQDTFRESLPLWLLLASV